MSGELTPEEREEKLDFARGKLFEDLENIIFEAQDAGMDRKDILCTFMDALAEVQANTLTPEEEKKKLDEVIARGKAWAEAHPDAMAAMPRMEDDDK